MEPELKIYTIADLRSWLIDNNPSVGLSEHVIAPVRAYAIINNPYVKDDDAVVAAIYEGDELAAYTAAFPDLLTTTGVTDDCGALENSENINVQLTSQLTGINVQERIWWATTLWCNPKYQGQGYGMIVVGSLMEAHEPELTYDRMGAHETVEIFKCLGYHTTFHNRYILSDKSIDRSSFKGKLAYCMQELQKLIHYTSYIKHHTPYTLKYSTFVDGEAYAFLQAHCGNDLFLREQKMLNWILQYPFMQSGLLMDKVKRETYFTSDTEKYQMSMVIVYNEFGNLCGVYVCRVRDNKLAIPYLYYCDREVKIVFDSIIDHIHAGMFNGFETENEQLAAYVMERVYFPRHDVARISFSIPADVDVPLSYLLQMGDGDSFA